LAGLKGGQDFHALPLCGVLEASLPLRQGAGGDGFRPLLLSRLLKTLAPLLASLSLVTKQLRDMITPFYLDRTAAIDIANRNMQSILAFVHWRFRFLSNE
jgi:hypothetical protein